MFSIHVSSQCFPLCIFTLIFKEENIWALEYGTANEEKKRKNTDILQHEENILTKHIIGASVYSDSYASLS